MNTMVFILIAMWSQGYAGGGAISQEFYSEKACLHAAKVLKEQRNLKVIACVPKGDMK